ncbi:MAG: hypothetical protein R3240_10590, partial [Gammaproteobacteria bacterium]|nr:hypothetical protein [Gammaproteobacteria bacterium]
LSISGNFYITKEVDAQFSSLNNPDNPVQIHYSNFDYIRQISDGYNYYYEVTNPGVTYDFKTDKLDVLVDVVDNMGNVIAYSKPKTDDTGQIVTITATSDKTYLRVHYTGADSGTNFTIRNKQGDLVAQGTATTPYVLGTGKIPLFAYGTVDTSTSYYEVDVTAGHEYLVHITNMIDADKLTREATSLEVSDNLDSYTLCVALADCRIASTTGKVYFKVNGNDSTPISFDIEVEYAPEQGPDQQGLTLSVPTVDHLGQVSYKPSVQSNPGSGGFASGMNLYWVPNTELETNSYYLISVSGINAFTSLWVNNQSSSLVKTCAAGTAYWGTSQLDVPSVLGEVYCVVKTNNYLSNPSGGFSFNIVGEFSGTGTTFKLNVKAIDPANLYYVSTYANAKTSGLGTAQATTGMNFYRPGESKPYTFKIPDGNNFGEKLLVLEPGETVYIQIFDAYGKGDYYSTQIRRDKFATSSAYFTVDDPDSYESGAGDNTMDTATEITVYEETHHSFSNNNDNFGDEDWFKFTAPLP